MLNVLALIWIGLILGVSFIATPAKFLAPSLSLPVALDVGRHTFGVFSLVEIVAAVSLVVAAILWKSNRLILLISWLTAAAVAFQFLWLLPVLDARVEMILQGAVPPASVLHTLYIICEVVKLLLLGLIAAQTRRNADTAAQA